ncbi:hypothetical protein CIT292_09238 [Citrobacter youngae ATCC 29220]|uniref:Uncharacterized protein n=1 Tax=Citrobacter youngae ATCC 29220 TaxID=500640 RepID=D4BG67_9ENTR|nr:hypothetical protein CIT292_09238 [Citrobacter youngae ATCC 29220]
MMLAKYHLITRCEADTLSTSFYCLPVNAQKGARRRLNDNHILTPCSRKQRLSLSGQK